MGERIMGFIRDEDDPNMVMGIVLFILGAMLLLTIFA